MYFCLLPYKRNHGLNHLNNKPRMKTETMIPTGLLFQTLTNRLSIKPMIYFHPPDTTRPLRPNI